MLFRIRTFFSSNSWIVCLIGSWLSSCSALFNPLSVQFTQTDIDSGSWFPELQCKFYLRINVNNIIKFQCWCTFVCLRPFTLRVRVQVRWHDELISVAMYWLYSYSDFQVLYYTVSLYLNVTEMDHTVLPVYWFWTVPLSTPKIILWCKWQQKIILLYYLIV